MRWLVVVAFVLMACGPRSGPCAECTCPEKNNPIPMCIDGEPVCWNGASPICPRGQ